MAASLSVGTTRASRSSTAPSPVTKPPAQTFITQPWRETPPPPRLNLTEIRWGGGSVNFSPQTAVRLSLSGRPGYEVTQPLAPEALSVSAVVSFWLFVI